MPAWLCGDGPRVDDEGRTPQRSGKALRDRSQVIVLFGRHLVEQGAPLPPIPPLLHGNSDRVGGGRRKQQQHKRRQGGQGRGNWLPNADVHGGENREIAK